MGFRSNAYATVWSVTPRSDTITKGRISINRKNKKTGEYEQEFAAYVDFVGSAAANKALHLKERSRIKLGDVDVSNFYDKEKNREYINFRVFSFEVAPAGGGDRTSEAKPESAEEVPEGDPDHLPF